MWMGAPASADKSPQLSTTVSDLRPLQGGLTVALVCLLWVSSILSPFLFAVALWRGWTAVAVALVAVTALAHSPLLGYVPAVSAAFRWAFERAFQSVTVRFEPGSAPGSSPSKLYAVHPHGVFTMGFIHAVLHPALRNVTFCFSSFLYNSPLFLILSKLVGRPSRADKESVLGLMRAGKDLGLTPGGFEEATLTSGGDAERVYIKGRKGFVKYCVQHGVSICPVYAFGEKRLYSNLQGAWRLRLRLNGYGVPTVLGVVGRWWWCPFVPRPHPVLVVVGSPLPLARNPSPTAEEVATAHARYVEALTALFDRHKVEAYGEEGKGLTLEVW